ncbi:MAG: putative FecR [Bryobacterales bacterium]|nr:putative FecR [Bryobacterales bacterium]
MKLDHLINEIRNNEPNPAEVEQAAARVRARLFPQSVLVNADSAEPTGAIRDCAGFVSLIPAHLAGTLDASRKMLLEVHTRECINCRKALAEARHGARQVIEFRPRKSAAAPYAPWAIAASVLFVAGSAAWVGYRQFPSLAGGARATVEVVDGALYKVSGSALTPLAPGAELAENDVVRTARNSAAILRLNDGSKVEVNQRAQLSVTRSLKGSTVHLAMGNIIVEAAKQRSGALTVTTADCNVEVKGTVFAVDAGTKGSRVAVVEGTVWVDHGTKHEVLKRGDSTATAADMGRVPIHEEFEWSRKSAQYAKLLTDFSELNRQIAAIPPAGLRYTSNLLGLLPADVVAVAAIPNIGNTLSQASQIFHERLKSSQTLAAWWNSYPPAKRADFERTIHQLETASAYLGEEIVLALPGGSNNAPIVLARLVRPGLDAFLRAQLPPSAEVDKHMRFDNDLFIAAADPAALTALSGGFKATPLYQRLSGSYQQGAGWLFGADLARVMPGKAPVAGFFDARFFIAESRTLAGNTENRASVTFARDRQGVAAWLSVPGPMGSLEYVSPDAGFAASMLMKNPAVIVDDMMGMLTPANGTAPDAGNIALRQEIASAFGGEVTVALDGPLLPFPSWKIAAEVYYPDRLQSAISRTVADFNAKGANERTGALKLTQTDVEGRTFYRLQFEKVPFEADWTYTDGYWLAAANQELVIRAIQNRQSGFTLSKSAAFKAQLPHDASTNFSGVVYHNLGPTLAPIMGLLGVDNTPAPGKKGDTPHVICFWAQSDRIDVATMGNIFDLDIQSLLGMSGSGPLKMLGQATGGLMPQMQQRTKQPAPARGNEAR